MTGAAAAISDRLARAAAEDRFAGAVLVRTGDHLLFSAGFGEANREQRVPNTPETRFRLGSASKMFTAAAALRLVQDGRLELGARVGDLLSDYPDAEVAHRVTVERLLTHTAGLGDVWGPVFAEHRDRLRTPADYVALFGRERLQHPIGPFRYSSYGYILLGRMLEVAAGEAFDALLANLVFAPADMADTGMLPENVSVARRVVGYTRAPEGWRSAAGTLPYAGTPAGGGYSTVGDIDRFVTALTSHRLLDPVHTDMLTQPHVDAGNGMHYAYGLMVTTHHGARVIGHTGAAPGMAASIEVCPERDWRVIVLSNRDPPAAITVARFIADQLLEAN